MINHTFVLRDRAAWDRCVAFIRANNSADHPLAVIVTEPKAQRTVDQNKGLHKLIRDLAEQAYVGGQQFSMTVWKEYIRDRFIGNERVSLPDGREHVLHRSTADLTVEEMTALIERVMRYAAEELGLELELVR